MLIGSILLKPHKILLFLDSSPPVCSKPKGYYYSLGQRYYANSGTLFQFYFSYAKSTCSGDSAQLAVISDTDTHDSVYSQRGEFS